MDLVGTASWAIPAQHKDLFPGEGTHLQRYARQLNAVEINTSFYRDHQAKTYVRWSESVPENFRFSVKLSRFFTHEQALQETGPLLMETLQDIMALGPKLGCVLVQLPPRLALHPETADRFFGELRETYQGPVALEPRHVSWASETAVKLLVKHALSRVQADPMSAAGNGDEEDFSGIRYYRLHGSPQIYKSDYAVERLVDYAEDAQKARERGLKTWCIFDNTTFGHATLNALQMWNSASTGQAPALHL